MSAIAECAEMLEEAERLSSQLDGVKGKMTSAQVNRLLKIENKMAGLATKAAGLEDKMESKMEDVKDKIENLDVDDILNNATNNLFGDF